MKVTRPRIEMPEMVPDLRPLRGSDTHTLGTEGRTPRT